MHPLASFGARRGWKYAQTASYFGVAYTLFRQTVAGHAGVSWKRAREWAARAQGEFSASEIKLWHDEHQKGAAA